MTAEEALKYFGEWKTAYGLAFASVKESPAFEDLAEFCHARKTCVVRGDREQSYVLEGRRQAYLRIMNFLELTPEQLVALHTRPATGATSHEQVSSQIPSSI